MSYLRRQDAEPLFESRAIEKTTVHFSPSIESATHHADIFELGHERANFRSRFMLNRTRNSTCYLLRVDREKKAPPQIGNKFQLSRGIGCIGWLKRQPCLFFYRGGYWHACRSEERKRNR